MSSKIFIILLLNISIYANPILTNYRVNGVDNLEKQMDLELTNTKYWNGYLKNIDTTFGYTESYSTILTCDKKKSTLTLYKQNENKKFTILKNYNAFTGQIQGDKKKEGDLKTPLGIYELTKKISKLDSFYGPLAFVTSYPNIYDKFRGKNGSGIWIHGLPTEQKRDEFTKGCIAINNSNLETLDKYININSTMLIINSSKTIQKVPKTTFSKLLAGLYEWRYNWLYNNTKKYLSFYSTDFIRDDGMKYSKFIQYKTRIFQKGEKKKIIFNNINIIPYPNNSNIFQITFKEFYTSNNFKFEGNKILMVKIDKNNN
ncbi:MAG: L,D-transpeptidase family protein, partial [Sulfurimonas sp.]|nr:L,D-transpeptidase family protein [Sulfurimonas sp.]